MCVPILYTCFVFLGSPLVISSLLASMCYFLGIHTMFLQFTRTLISTMYIRESITLFKSITIIYGTDFII
jgi:hypothetical protein